MLDISRILSGKLALDMQQADVVEVVNRAIEVVRSNSAARNVTVEVSGADKQLVMETDPVRLEQVVWNLVNNAVQASADGGRVEVSYRAVGSTLCVEVRDWGKGIEDTDPCAYLRALSAASVRGRWTHALAINDVVFDFAVPTLIAAGVPSKGLSLVSAGDGSSSAFLRIQAKAYQTGTVAEPLNQQGWQLLDELFTAPAGQQVVGDPFGWQRWFESVGATHPAMRAGPRFDPFSMIIKATSAKLGVGLVSRCILEPELTTGQIEIAFDKGFQSDYGCYLTYPEKRRGSKPMKALLHWLLKKAAAS